MNWKLIAQLSMFGLAMALGTVFVIPEFWQSAFLLPLQVLSAWLIARRTKRPFLHGLLTGLANSVWITAAHIIFFDRYVTGHPQDAQVLQLMPNAPRLLMALTGPLAGALSGAMMGVLAWIFAKMLRKPA
jgi:hypothetical protein